MHVKVVVQGSKMVFESIKIEHKFECPSIIEIELNEIIESWVRRSVEQQPRELKSKDASINTTLNVNNMTKNISSSSVLPPSVYVMLFIFEISCTI